MTKVSEITINDIANYLRIDVSDTNKNELETYLKVAINYISNYTGITEKSEDSNSVTLDTYADLVIVVFVLCQDMYDNRCLYVDKNNINNTIQTILDMHRRNLL